MGICGSKPKGCVRVRSKLELQRKQRMQRARRKKATHCPSNKQNNRVEPSSQTDLSYCNPAFQDSWFDPDSVIDSDCEDEFFSVPDDASQAGSISTGVTPRFSNHVAQNSGSDSHLNHDDYEAKDASGCEISSVPCVDETADADQSGNLHSCGFLSNTFLPCLACDESLDGKRKTPHPGGPSTRKKLSLIPSFKWKDGQEHNILSSAKPITRRPIAGSQIMCSSLEKNIAGSWSQIDPNTFKVRGKNYNKDKRKEAASSFAAYVPFGADLYLSPRKINHVAQFVELPAIDSSGEVPPILVIPLYTATIFQNENDGPGMNVVFYFKISENYSKCLPVPFQENFRRIINNETERIKGFAIDTISPIRERLKILAGVANIEDLELNGAERKLMHAYNEKPILSRPQHEFYTGENYFEIDLDIHRFSYIARKGFQTFQDRIKHCIFDFGLTIQGNKAEDLPECLLCCIRLKELDYSNYGQLSL
ncbi:hypothetical protein F511_20757 [Dorcoceras hygrometricum]|uniref:Protein ENHANCED DISEASE RESISTANCE 2 C-terminal domain-containing protein n=1 Tax=Dorcoceras hygrometricum TaxID=472368 RepID=A0A2Z7A6X2_9LAMI|nr:hypothetical protein F511_20757 [Dorcoceras hygrometricum]